MRAIVAVATLATTGTSSSPSLTGTASVHRAQTEPSW
jgi:hypothetical protein